MKIQELIWPQDQIDHIAAHGIKPEEVEEVCFGQPFLQRTKSEGEKPGIMCLDKRNRDVIYSVS